MICSVLQPLKSKENYVIQYYVAIFTNYLELDMGSGLPNNTLQEENFHWNVNFAISLMANSLDSYSIFININKFQKPNFTINYSIS